MSQKESKKYRIYHPETHCMWGPVEATDASGQTQRGWGWISLANDQAAWGDGCIFEGDRMCDQVKKLNPEAVVLPA